MDAHMHTYAHTRLKRRMLSITKLTIADRIHQQTCSNWTSALVTYHNLLQNTDELLYRIPFRQQLHNNYLTHGTCATVPYIYQHLYQLIYTFLNRFNITHNSATIVIVSWSTSAFARNLKVCFQFAYVHMNRQFGSNIHFQCISCCLSSFRPQVEVFHYMNTKWLLHKERNQLCSLIQVPVE